ncbi:MAG: acetate--CoA ligase family protein, partial [Deltaproteobacteria bacterium]|nr:acetate--CoA ligase family protein [Deltaproteobacteria bacterium]
MTENNFLLEPDGVKIAQKYGVPYPDHGLARSPEEAAALAERLGLPVVLKIVSPEIVHKSDLGGVLVGLASEEEVRRGYEEMTAACGRAVSRSALVGVLVSRQVQEGLEVIVGAIEDAVFGPTVMFGLGGIFTEVFKDVAFRIAPLERLDAEEMIREIKGY